MGLEIIVLLVDVSRLKLTLDLAWDTLYDGLEKRTLRNTRPVQDSRLKVLFDIDAEAELLDWMDAQPWGKDEKKSFHQLLEESTDGEKGLLLAMKWASPGAWEVWEARAILYFENATGVRVENSNDLISLDSWTQIFESLDGINESEFSEKVCMDWMERRLELGETLDETQDPRIAPTFEAHNRNSKALVHAVNLLENDIELKPLFGREYLPAFQWHYGVKTLGMISNE